MANSNLSVIVKVVDQASGGLKGISRMVKQSSADIRAAGMALTAVGAAITASLGFAVKTAMEFESAMARTLAVTGAATDEFAAMNEVVRELGRTTMFSANEVAQATAYMGMAGMNAAQIMGALPDTLNLAAAGALELGRAADIVTNVMAGYGMQTEELAGAVDVLTKTFTSSNTSLDQLGGAMAYVGPVAKGFGMDFKEVSAAIGMFGNAGIQGERAGTALRGALVQLSEKGAEFGLQVFDATGKMLPLADILYQIEHRGLDAAQMMDLFGQEAGPAMMALLSQGSVALRDYTKDLADSGGAAAEIAEIQRNTLAGQLKILENTFQGFQIAIADVLTPVIIPLVQALTGIILKVQEWAEANPELFQTIVLVAGAIGIFAAVVGPILLALPTIAAGIAALVSPVGLVIAAIAALIAIGVIVWQNWDSIVNDFKNLWAGLVEFMRPIAERIAAVIDIVLAPLKAIIDALKWISQLGAPAQTAPSGGYGPGSTTTPGMTTGQMTSFMTASYAAEAMAEGGIVTRPTRALIGEAGPEAVIPLSGAGMPGETVVHTHISLDGREIAETVSRHMGINYSQLKRIS
jgi:TP901 family phage tail tape measure protein